MASPIQTAAFLFLVLAGVKAADKELGETCTDADSCVHPTLGLVCDVVAKKCMIKHGQSCAGAGHGDLCVAGADCSSGTCTCKASVYSEDTATGQCTATAAKWGSLCPNSNECTDASLQCTAGICVCVDDKQVDLATGLCSVDVATSKVGKVCTTAGEDSANCGSQTTTHLECPTGGGTCFCQRGFAGSIGEDCTAVSGMKVGLACTSGGSECGTQATTHLTCPSANCACESGYYGVPGGDCYPAKGKLDGGCSGSGQGTCEDTNAECTGSAAKKCSCKSGYQAASGSCAEIPQSKVGHTCTADTATADCGDATTTYLECSTTAPTVCVCSTGYSGSPGGDCATAVAPGKVGGDCTADTANTKGTCEDANALCSATTGGTCGCKTGYTGTNGAGCTIPDNKYGGGCTTTTTGTSGTCEDAKALCSAKTGGTCGCKTGFIGTVGAGCSIPPGKYGGSCTADTANTKGTCEDVNAQCSATTGGTCGCKSGYSGTDGAGCIADNKLGGACTGGPDAKGSCEDTNALCSSAAGKCSCKDGYMGDDAGSCSEIPANTYGGSCTTDTADTKGSCNDDNALCTDTTDGLCDCADGYTGTEGKGCVADNAVGGMCTTTAKDTKGTCTDDNAVCTRIAGGRCKCRMNYSEDSAGVCKANGAVAVVASATAVILSVFVGLLCMA